MSSREYTFSMRWAKSYSIVDHQLLHGGYFEKLSHEALVLYLFLIVVGDKNGRSFYADATIGAMLRLTSHQLNHARSELTRFGLMDYRRPYWWVKTIEGPPHERPQTKDPLSERCPGAFVSSDPRPIGDLTKESLKALFQNFRRKNDEKDIPA